MKSLGRSNASCFVLAGLLVSGAPAAAQVAPPLPPGAIPGAPTREEIERAPTAPVARPPARLTVEGGIERAPCPLAGDRFKDISVTLSAVQFDNLRVVPAEMLRPAYEAYIGRTVPIAAVCEIRDAAATILRRAGYLAAVQVPPQRIENGVVHFDVLMAKLVAVQVRGDAGRSEKLVASYLERIKGQEAFNEKDAERYLLLARDLPGFDVRLTLRPAGTVPARTRSAAGAASFAANSMICWASAIARSSASTPPPNGTSSASSSSATTCGSAAKGSRWAGALPMPGRNPISAPR
ncbi:MAG: POTRA domain-containing protein [Sphingomonas sp.]|nr:POTRA domain-containing protein [Sphingomonas sp.]MDX3884945.1 POTRA domain-containing protein [Sphingomonas sp.]